MTEFSDRPGQTGLEGSGLAETHFGSIERVWWTEPRMPFWRVSFDAVHDCIPQIDEPLGGRQSCRLTAMLNAWVVRGYLSSEEAEHVQDTAATDRRLARYWADQTGISGEFAWGGQSTDAAYIVWRLIGKRMGLRLATADELPAALNEGFAASVSNGRHCRVVFRPEPDGQVVLCDTKYTELTGHYSMQEIMGLEMNQGPKKVPLFVSRQRPVVVV